MKLTRQWCTLVSQHKTCECSLFVKHVSPITLHVKCGLVACNLRSNICVCSSSCMMSSMSFATVWSHSIQIPLSAYPCPCCKMPTTIYNTWFALLCIRFRRDLVEDVVQQHKAYKNNNPAYIWSGSFRDKIPYTATSDQRQWVPAGPKFH